MREPKKILMGMAGYLRRHRIAVGAIAVLVLLYALAGFFLAPWLISRQLIAFARNELGLQVAVRRVEINPFALSVRVQGLRLQDRDGSDLIGFDDLVINFEAESLFRWTWTFSEVRLSDPYLKVARNHDGVVNLAKLMPPSPKQPSRKPSGLPRVMVQKFRLEKGVIDFEDAMAEGGFRSRVGPFGVSLDDFSTLPDETGRQSVAIALEGTRIAWSGDLSMSPLESEGRITLEGPVLELAHRYLRNRLKFGIAPGSELSAAARYRLDQTSGGGVEIAVNDVEGTVTGVSLSAPDAPDFLGWAELKLAGGEARWPERRASIGRVMLSGVKLIVRRAADGNIDVVGLLSPEPESEQETGNAPAAEPGPVTATSAGAAWRVKIAEAGLRDMTVDFTDSGSSTAAKLNVADLDLTLRNVVNEAGAKFALDSSVVLGGGGTIGLAGTVSVLPSFALDADLQIGGLELKQAQPYLSDIARVDIRDGALAVDGHIKSDDGEAFAFRGNIRILKLDTQDLVKNQGLLAWSELALDDVAVLLTHGSAKIERARLVKPFGRILIAPDKTTNIGALLVERKRGTAASNPASQPGAGSRGPFRVRIGKVLVSDGEMDFADRSLPLPFAARVRHMKGDLTAVDTGSALPSRISLEGQVNEYGLARVNGELRIAEPTELADINVLFRNIEMPPLSPYAVEFAGRKIARGKINLDLRYKLDKRKLTGANKITIDELELGEKIPSAGAVDLPLGLAVALLKDANGRIDVNMPVSGDVDDPNFDVGRVIRKAFVNLITKIVSSPFRLLGSLIGVKSEDFGTIDFSPGRSDLLPPAREQLARIAEALGKRPGITVEIPAVVDPKADAAVLRTRKMQEMVMAELAASGVPKAGRDLEKSTRKAVETLYEREFPDHPLEDIQKAFTMPRPEKPGGKPRLDETAYLDALRADIAGAQVISEDALRALATSRAAAIRTELTTNDAVPAARVRIGGSKDVTARADGTWIPAELSLSPAVKQRRPES